MTADTKALDGGDTDPQELRLGGLTLRIGRGAGDRAMIAQLREASFGRSISDPFDDLSLHFLVQRASDGFPLATCRVRLHVDHHSVAAGYTGQFYDLTGLGRFGFPLVEMGRLCTAQGTKPEATGNPAALRLILAGIADHVLKTGAGALFGCTSFRGAVVGPHAAALDHLARNHGQPSGQPAHAIVQATRKVALSGIARHQAPSGALLVIPPLLRSYLSLGAWVGPEAVLDHDLDTLHVLTVLQIARILPARRAALAAFVAACGGHAVDGTEQSA
jgi:putative hemolysin